MPEITPNPDTPLVNAYSYNFGKRVRQPGGRRLQTCLPSKGTQGKPACQCYVFNNWGRPDTLTLSFAGFDNCSHQCGTLLDSHDAPGMGPFTLDFYQELDQHFDTTTGEWVGGGLGVISGAPSNGNGLASGLGYSCVWRKTGVGDVIDACAGGGPITATVQIGWDTVAGVFCQIQLTGNVLYYSWTWTHLPVTPGQLDCSGNAPESCRLAYLLTANTQGEAEYALGVHNATGSPNTFWYEFQAENDGQSCFMFNADGRNKLDYSRLCQGCSDLGQIDANQPNASAAVVCCPAGKDGPCGTNEVAPPCCCGDTSGDPPNYECRCVYLCLANTDPESNCSAEFQLCLDPNQEPPTFSGTGNFFDGSGMVSASLTFDGTSGKWQLTSSCFSGPLTIPKFPSASNSPISPASSPSAAGCCSSGDFDVTLSCTPLFCPFHGPPPCCTGDFPGEIKVTLPALVNNSQAVYGDPAVPNPCDCGKYAGEYFLSFLRIDGDNVIYQLADLGSHCTGCAEFNPCPRANMDSITATVSCNSGGQLCVNVSLDVRGNAGVGCIEDVGLFNFQWSGCLTLDDQTGHACCGHSLSLPYLSGPTNKGCLYTAMPCLNGGGNASVEIAPCS